MRLYLDTETFNRQDIKVGTYKYAETAEIMMIQWAIDDGPVYLWDYSEGYPPPDLASFVNNYNPVVIAHGAMFDRNVLRLGNLKIPIPIEQWQCTLVQAYQHALPGKLAILGEVLGLCADQQKNKRGEALIKRFCKPAPSNHKADRYDRISHPTEWAELREYAKQDIIALREVHRRLPVWNWTAEDVAQWHLDQRINDRGFRVDIELVEAGARAALEEKESLTARFAELTGGLKPTQRAKAQAFINQQFNTRIGSTAKHVLQPLIDDPATLPVLGEIAQIMLSANKTSTAKYAKIAQAVSVDGRFRGGLQFAGAARTRRWAGRVFQPQNLPSRGLPKEDMIAAYIAALKAGNYRLLFDDLMLYGAAALRSVVIA